MKVNVRLECRASLRLKLSEYQLCVLLLELYMRGCLLTARQLTFLHCVLIGSLLCPRYCALVWIYYMLCFLPSFLPGACNEM